MRSILLSLLILQLFASNARSDLITDTEFAVSDWTEIIAVQDSGVFLQNVTQELSGGNPGAYREFTHFWDNTPGNETLVVGHIFTGDTYDPAIQGGINNVSLSLDWSARFDDRGSSGGTGIGLAAALTQNGNLYLEPGGQPPNQLGSLPGPWVPFNSNDLTASDFQLIVGSGPINPDFSNTGAPIQFGFRASNSSGFNPATITHGIDNFQITTTGTQGANVPEPSGLVIIAFSIGAAGIYHRRQRNQR